MQEHCSCFVDLWSFYSNVIMYYYYKLYNLKYTLFQEMLIILPDHRCVLRNKSEYTVQGHLLFIHVGG